MKKAILKSTGFEITESAIPSTKPDGVVIKVQQCGVCSGDLHLYRTKQEIDGSPLELGHEVTGIVESVGDEVNSVKPGDRVTAVDGVGGYADYFSAPEMFVTKLPDDLDEDGALGEPIACCVHAINRVNFDEVTSAAVLGCGFMGLICIQLLKAKGVQHITAIDPVTYRRQMAFHQGADSVLAIEDISEYNKEDGLFDLIVEAAGVQPALDSCTDLVKQHGQILIVGYHQSGNGVRSIDMQMWNFKAIDVINGHIRRMDEKFDAMVEGIELCRSGDINLKPFIQTYPLDNIADAFTDLTNPDKQIFKAVIQYD